MSQRSVDERPAGASDRSVSVGTLVLGAIFVVAGLFWLLDALDLLAVSWVALLAVFVILIGLGFLFGARTADQAALLVLALGLALVLTFAALVDVPFAGGIGERVVRPASVRALEADYPWAVGRQLVDLRGVALPVGETRIRARVGLGELVVLVPEDVPLAVAWEVGAGEAEVLGRQQSGISLDGRMSLEGAVQAPRRLLLDTSIGLGTIEVRR